LFIFSGTDTAMNDKNYYRTHFESTLRMLLLSYTRMMASESPIRQGYRGQSNCQGQCEISEQPIMQS